MEMDRVCIDHNDEEEEYVLLDLSGACSAVDIDPDAPYVLSGLDTMNPVLTIGNDLKLIGEYEETVGTCLIFSENEKAADVNEETRGSEASKNQGSSKQIKPVTSLHKILKFRLLIEDDAAAQSSKEKPPDSSLPSHTN